MLYFIQPTGHSLREIDIEFMRRLGTRVNVIPVIAKADTLTPPELTAFKKLIMEDIAHYKIPIYNFPYDEEEDEEETILENNELRVTRYTIRIFHIYFFLHRNVYLSLLLEVRKKLLLMAVVFVVVSIHGGL